MRTIRSIFGLLLGILTLGAIASAVSALVVRRQVASSGTETDDEFDLVTIFDSLEFRSIAPGLRRGSSLCWYGGGTIDLRGAALDPSGADLTLRAVFGGLRLVVPASWPVQTRLTSLFGGVADARDAELVDSDGPVLRIVGFALFGGVAILDRAPDLDAADAASVEDTGVALDAEMPAAAPA